MRHFTALWALALCLATLHATTALPVGSVNVIGGITVKLPDKFTFVTSDFKGFATQQAALDAVLPIAAFPDDAFKAFKATFNVQIPAAEEVRRFAIFKNNTQAVLRINQDKSNTWFAGINQFATQSWLEFAQDQLKAIPEPDTDLTPPTGITGVETATDVRPRDRVIDWSPVGTTDTIRGNIIGGLGNLGNLPTFEVGGGGRRLSGMGGGRSLQQLPTKSYVDWKAKAGPVRNQGKCGSCWAFAAIGSVEALYRIQKPSVIGANDLSEEQVVDCADIWRLYWSWACDGGYVSEALRYSRNNMISFEAQYPYAAQDSNSCESSRVKSLTSARHASNGRAIRDYTRVNKQNYVSLANSVAVNPTTTSFKVVDSFQHYAGGVYSSGSCGGSTNHAMLIVGYNTQNSVVNGKTLPPHWVIKNSWGSWWGENGYIRVSMIKSTNSNGMCGMYKSSYRPYF